MNNFQFNVNALQQQFSKINSYVKKIIVYIRSQQLNQQQQKKRLFNFHILKLSII